MATVRSYICNLALIVSILASSGVAAQEDIRKLSTLPQVINEASGMVAAKNGGFWLLNDSGGNPELYLINRQGELLKKVWVENAVNGDWEALTKDLYGSVYIGDIGNNRNNRKDLVVYRVWEDELLENDTVHAFKMAFDYDDQSGFPPNAAQMHYDAEGLIFLDKKLFILTKNRATPYTGLSYSYELRKTGDRYKAFRTDSIKTGNIRETSWITDAGLSEDGRHLALLSHGSLWVVSDFHQTEFSSVILSRINLGHASQKEALCWHGDTLFMADERNDFSDGHLYSLNLSSHIAAVDSIRRNELTLTGSTYSDTIFVEADLSVKGMAYYELFDSNGRRMDYGKIGVLDKGKYTFHIVPKELINSYYMLNIRVGNRPHGFFINKFKKVEPPQTEGE